MRLKLTFITATLIVAAAFFVQGTLGSQTGGRANQTNQNNGDHAITLGTKLVNVTVTALDRYGRCVSGLDQSMFDVYDNGVRQQIAHFTEEDMPVSVGIVYDVSGSMSPMMQRSAQVLRRFIEVSHPEDEFFLVTFASKPSLAQDFTTSPDAVANRLVLVKAGGSTALYDAVYIAIEKLKEGRHAKKALLIISDGEENHSRYSLSELGELVKESGALVYAVGVGYREVGYPNAASFGHFGQKVLNHLTALGGGKAFYPQLPEDDLDACLRIALELRHQYSIGFYPSDVTSGRRWRELKVNLNAPHVLGRLALIYRRDYPAFNN